MALCSLCAEICLENAGQCHVKSREGVYPRDHYLPYKLWDTAHMEAEVAKGSEGCKGCVFFARFIPKSVELRYHNDDERRQVLQARLCRHYGTYRIDLEFWRGIDRVFSRHPLRICRIFGRETTKSTETLCNRGTQIAEHPDEVSLGRPIADDSRNDECLSIASMWLERCTKYHGNSCQKLQDVELPTRLVHIPDSDTENLNLQMPGKEKGRYVAFSYCWGSQGIDFTTTLKTLPLRMQGFQAAELPQSFQNAIDIARRLKFQYIWIDALCIIQDDNDDWSREASQMAKVYGKASLTLSADRAGSSSDGIFHKRSTHRSPCFEEELFLQAIGHGWSTIIDMPLSERGWAFQERFLSPRTIHYLEEQMAWECRTGIFLEEHGSCLVPGGHFAQFLFQGPIERDDLAYPVNGSEELRRNATSYPTYDPMNTTFRVHSWNECIREWSFRKFTEKSDRLPSLSGLAAAAQMLEMGDYVAGLWQYDIFNSMSWFPEGQFTVEDSSTEYIAPSWSWASAGCPIFWCHGLFWSQPGLYKTETYKEWETDFAPHLREHNIYPLNDANLNGKIREGSYLLIECHARDMYVGDSPAIEPCSAYFFERTNCHGPSCRQPWDHGTMIRIDSIGSKWNVPGSFTRDNVGRVVDNTDLNITKYVCVQISRLGGANKCEFPKVVGLLLEEMNDGFRRVGVATFDISIHDSIEWKRKVLKLY